MEINKQAYDAYVKEVTPVHNKWLSIVKAFLVGVAICTIGQLVSTWFMNSGMDKDTAATWTLLVLIAGSVILTGLNIYPVSYTQLDAAGGGNAPLRGQCQQDPDSE